MTQTVCCFDKGEDLFFGNAPTWLCSCKASTEKHQGLGPALGSVGPVVWVSLNKHRTSVARRSISEKANDIVWVRVRQFQKVLYRSFD